MVPTILDRIKKVVVNVCVCVRVFLRNVSFICFLLGF